jgi:RimJ/RimL family protein N-acetyltransferase
MALRPSPADLDTLERWGADPEAQGRHNWFGFSADGELRHRGRGHGAEAQRQLAAYLFAHTRVERLEASTDVENTAEQRALERAGFAREGILRSAQFRDGTFHDLVLYGRLRGDRPSQV